jgi:HSP20 family molecular chaperone IbpA
MFFYNWPFYVLTLFKTIDRTIKVPDNFDVSQTTSCYKNGILTVTVKKLPQEKSDVRKLQIL